MNQSRITIFARQLNPKVIPEYIGDGCVTARRFLGWSVRFENADYKGEVTQYDLFFPSDHTDEFDTATLARVNAVAAALTHNGAERNA